MYLFYTQRQDKTRQNGPVGSKDERQRPHTVVRVDDLRYLTNSSSMIVKPRNVPYVLPISRESDDGTPSLTHSLPHSRTVRPPSPTLPHKTAMSQTHSRSPRPAISISIPSDHLINHIKSPSRNAMQGFFWFFATSTAP